ncbi:hypothetical protein RhiirA4_525247 [Rhizophagus irregularis]|jgi:hypothetical protein|uniref:MATA-HMG n=1 Tax=Rhizophagus irregularis TaxID=588596 RepID=A0A2I1GP89_9GLOM|nr:hypothetical protein RhiirA4_525247 [Rhizophagus irregularis]
MPKTFLKQKNRKRETSINVESLNDIKPSFPSTLTISDLIKKVNTNNKPKVFPNAFIAYRMALMKEYRIKNCKTPSVGKVSKIAKNHWNMEPKYVKEFYESLVNEAKLIYNKNNVQIILDKHVSNVVINQERNVNFDVGREEEHVEVQHINTNFSFPNASSNDMSSDIPLVNSSQNFRTSYNANSTLSDREYIRYLEQTIDRLLGN